MAHMALLRRYSNSGSHMTMQEARFESKFDWFDKDSVLAPIQRRKDAMKNYIYMLKKSGHTAISLKEHCSKQANLER